MRFRTVLAVLVAAGVVLCAGVVEGAWFMPLPQLPGSMQAGDAFAVSADGSTVVGTSHDGLTNQAVKWTADGTVLELLNAGDSSYARGVAADGQTVAAYRNVAGPGFQEALRWTETTGITNIGDLAGGPTGAGAYGVSDDGLVLVGSSFSDKGGEAFRWTAAEGMSALGDLPGLEYGGVAYGASRDGSVIVGYSRSFNGSEAFWWTTETGMVGLGDLPGGGFFSEAYDVSDDGSVVVGRSSASSDRIDPRAFRWTAQTGMIEVSEGGPELGPTRIAEAVSGDGNVIVGSAYGPDGAFAWDAFHGTRSIAKILDNQGVDVAGWDLGIARGVSFDGTTIVGLGINPEGKQQPWLARLDGGTFVPEPDSYVLIVLGLLAVLGSAIGGYRPIVRRTRSESLSV
jgi:probable HAF family extracellular repeat protein